MKSIALFLRNFLILELTLFIPGMVAIFGFMPDRLDIQLETKSPLSVSVGFATYCEDGCKSITGKQFAGIMPSRDAEPLSYFFADDFDAGSFQLEFTGNAPKVCIKKIALVRNLLVRYEIAPRELCKLLPENSRCRVEQGESGAVTIIGDWTSIILSAVGHKPIMVSFSGFELPDLPGVAVCFWGFHGFLFVLALLGLFVPGKAGERPDWKISLIVSIVGAFLFAIAIPAQTIFGNRTVFDFPLWTVVAQLLFAFLTCLAVFYVMVYLLSMVFAYWPHIIFVSLIVYEYLHTGIMSAGHPSLNGSIVFYMKTVNAIPDFICLLVIFGGFILASKWIKHYLHWIALGMFVMIVASLFDVRSGLVSLSEMSSQADIPWVHTNKEIADGMRLSPTRNVILIISDSNQSNAAFDIIQGDAALKSEFEGFCAYKNNIGMHEDTRTAVPGIFSGEWCPDPEPQETYLGSIFKARSRLWSDNSVVTAFEKSGLPTYVLTGVDGLAHSNRIEHRKLKNRLSMSRASIFLKRTESMNLCLMDCYRFRVVPFVLKRWSLRVSELGLGSDDGTHWERTLYPMLMANELSDEHKMALSVIYGMGSHAPVHFDEDGNRVYNKDKDSYKGYCSQVHFVLKCIAEYLRDLKRKGVYDNSLIIIVGDHGIQDPMSNWPDSGDIPSGAMPMLWIKPMHDKGEMTFSETPTSHAKIAEVMKQSIAEDLTQKQIGDLLYTEIRHYRKGRDFDSEFSDMYFDAEGTRIN